MEIIGGFRSPTMSKISVPINGHRSGSASTPKGGRTKSKCSCRRAEHKSREAISRGLRLIRTRFSVPNGELPDLEMGELGKYLSDLQNPGRLLRPSTPFPRRQVSSSDGIPSLTRLGRQERWELALSVASLKRGVRTETCSIHPPPSMKEAWFNRACMPDPPPSSPEYLAFVRKVIRREFRLGWDSSYESFSQSFIPKDSSRAEKGVSSALDAWRRNHSYEEWLSALRRDPGPLDWSLRYKEVPTVGKVRAMGIPTSAWDYLGPLHKSMYQYMTSRKWLLRGSPSVARVSRAARGFSEFTSVDLVAATDGLKVDVAEAILGTVLAKASHIPGHVRCLAATSLRPTCEGQELTYGQNMGTYLSFPLLCLQSYCAARWATRGMKAEILVNGDDTVIFGDRSVPSSAYPEGFQLNDGKTVRSRTVVELNSTVFLLCGGKWRKVKNLRRGTAYPDVSGVTHTASVCKDAGRRWVDALAQSRLCKSWCPKELGLEELSSPAVYAWFTRRKRFGGRTVVKPERAEQRFELSDQEPAYGDMYCFRKDLFEGGRGGSERPLKEGPRDIGMRNRLRTGKLRSLLSVDPWSRAARGYKPPVKTGRMYCYSSAFSQVEDYWDIQEEKIALGFWLP